MKFTAESVRIVKTLSKTAVSPLIPSVRSAKVFAIGFNKTGTTSLHDIFQDLGYHSYHGKAWRDTGRKMIFHHYDAFTDGPPDDFRRLDRDFVGSKFILQTRDMDEWIDSRLEHIRRLPHLRGRPADWVVSEAAICSWVRERNRYHSDVMQYFRPRPQDLLVVNYIRDPDSAARVCAFLGRPGFGQKKHSNANPNAGSGKVLKNADMITRALTSLAIPSSEWKSDLLCPSLLPEQARGQWPADTQELGQVA